jgi:hypothetical protein
MVPYRYNERIQNPGFRFPTRRAPRQKHGMAQIKEKGNDRLLHKSEPHCSYIKTD